MRPNRIKDLKQLARVIPVTRYLHYRDWLKALYAAAKVRLDGYTYLLFADDLGFSQTNVMRLVVTGQRPLTVKAATKIADALSLSGAVRKYWLALVAYNGERVPAKREQLFQSLVALKAAERPDELDPLQAEYFSEWYHPVIREMTALSAFDGTPEWVRDHAAFPLRLDQIRRSLALLDRLKVIRFDPALARYVRSEAVIQTHAEVDSLAVVRYHQKMIEIGKESITTVDEDRRDVRAVTMAISESQIPLLKGKIEAWIQELASMDGGDQGADQVVQVNVQMFPFLKQRKDS